MAENPVRVLLADDHTLSRDGLARLLTSRGDIEVVGQASGDERAVELARRERPDVVIMQAQPPARAKEILSGMLGVSPPPKVVICAMLEDPRYERVLLGLGASAYLLKTASAEQLADAVRAAVTGPEGRHAVVGMPRGMLECAGESPGALSEREMEVLVLVARGLPNHRVASRLYLSESTVRRHLVNIYRKMGVHSRTEAAREALSKG